MKLLLSCFLRAAVSLCALPPLALAQCDVYCNHRHRCKGACNYYNSCYLTKPSGDTITQEYCESTRYHPSLGTGIYCPPLQPCVCCQRRCLKSTYAGGEECLADLDMGNISHWQTCEAAGGQMCNITSWAAPPPPTETPTVRPLSDAPSDSPSKAPSDAPTDVPQFHVVCGKGTGCAEGNERPARVTEKHVVRCCADTNLEETGWKKQDHCAMWASSLISHCHETSLVEATQICEDAGARLCTKIELADRCTIKTGCGFDGRLVWSSSPVVDLVQAPLVDPAKEFQVVCGKGTGCTEGNEWPAAAAEEHAVRCCADSEVPGWKKQDHCDVWAKSPGCQELSYAEATQFCSYHGARLCTKTEVADMCTIKTGCGFDGHLIWSSSPMVD